MSAFAKGAAKFAERTAATLKITSRKEPTMSEYDTQLRLECLRLANDVHEHRTEVVNRASAYFDFITGADRAAHAEKAKAAIDEAVR
jgi:hypothetical protein